MVTPTVPLVPFVVTRTESGAAVELVGSLVKFHKGGPESVTVRHIQPFRFIPNSDWTLTNFGEAVYERLLATGIPISQLIVRLEHIEICMAETVDELVEVVADSVEAATRACSYRPERLPSTVLEA